MTIKDIAKIAGVSVSTVSKIINNKDQNISAQTKDKVLKIVDEYQFTPYSNILNKSQKKSRLIGLCIPDISNEYYANLIKYIEVILSEKGYSIIIYNTENSLQKEKKAIDVLVSRDVECIVLIGNIAGNESVIKNLNNTPFIVVDYVLSGNISIQYAFEKATKELLDFLYEKNMTKSVILISEKDTLKSKTILKQYKMSQSKISNWVDDSLIFKISDVQLQVTEALEVALRIGADVIIGCDMEIIREIYYFAKKRGLSIPDDISVVGFDDLNCAKHLIPKLTSISFPFEEMAKKIITYILKIIYDEIIVDKQELINMQFYRGKSVRDKSRDQKASVLTVGGINMDVFLSVTHLPTSSEAIIINNQYMLPGGKGANQAIGVAKLNGNSTLIGKLGNDANGKELYNNLIRNNVNVDCVTFDNNIMTGIAYIYVSDDAQYSIGLHLGANSKIDSIYVNQFETSILKADYCLLQLELPSEVQYYIIKLCKKHNIKVILKPAPAKQLPDEILDELFLLVPNETEITQMCPNISSHEDKVQFFLEKGVKNVILTLGKNGCYHSDGITKKHFPGIKIDAVDTTGASDVFISTLVVYLADGKSMHKSIEYANIGAGISVARYGVQSSMPDKKSIEMYYNNL